MTRLFAATSALLGVLGLAAAAHAAGQEPAAAAKRVLLVIVNKTRQEAGLSKQELAHVFRGDRKFWGDQQKIELLLPAAGMDVEAKTSFLSHVLQLNAAEFARLWQERVFRGESARPPRTPPDDRAAAELVFRSERVVAVVEQGTIKNLADVAKVLAVDGKFPGQPGYPLAW